MFYLTSWLLIFTGMYIKGLIVYDCRGPSTNITAVSLHDVAPCPSPQTNYTEKKINVRVIQKNDYSKIKVKTCLIEVTRLIRYCGMNSHVSDVHQGLMKTIRPIGRDECRKLHNTGTYIGYSGNVISNIKVNATTSASITVAGKLSMNGDCEGTVYTENGQTWSRVVVTAAVTFMLKEYYATIALDSNEISLMGGVTCPFVDGYCMDVEAGETIWDEIEQGACKKRQYSIIYEGIGTEVSVSSQDTVENYLVVEQDEYIFALNLLRKGIVCNYEVWVTEHPRLLVTKSKNAFYHLNSKTHDVNNINLLTYVNSKFMYIEISSKLLFRELHVQAVYRRCLIKREVLRNRLLMAPLNTNAIASIFKTSLGYMGRVLGEVLYIIKCEPKIAEVRRVDKCYNELPILVNNNESLFMAPITHVVQEHAEEIMCSPVAPSLFYIENRWVGFSPYPTVYNSPASLEINDENNIKFSPIRNLGSGGLYTQNEIDKIQHNFLFGSERDAITSFLVNRVAGRTDDSNQYDTTKLFSSKEIKRIAKSTLSYAWGWFTDIGIFMSGFMGIYIAFIILKYICSVILNGFVLYQALGCGFSIIASFWTTLTSWFLHRSYNHKVSDPENQEDFARVQDGHSVQPTAPHSSKVMYPEIHIVQETP
ncbi:uncharacterized protein [Onthophagus taurus]|uniref:uncharacterized protein n=1 Tax=Onthophagus taurus TaxID=166361 RepID=UPI0039BEAF05